MRNLPLALLALAAAGCADRALPINGAGFGDGGGGGQPDLSVRIDMPAPPIDMARQPADLSTSVDLKGITCGAQTCNSANQECCVSPTTGAAGCANKGQCNRDLGAVLTCDGPEDCTGGMPSCCATIGGAGGGSAMCSSSCPGSATPGSGGSFNATTKLCHGKGDCAGYNGTVNFGGTQTLPFNQCCELPQANGFRFCAPGLITMIGGTCF